MQKRNGVAIKQKLVPSLRRCKAKEVANHPSVIDMKESAEPMLCHLIHSILPDQSVDLT